MNTLKTKRPQIKPLASTIKKQVTLRIDSDVLDAFKVEGKGWQTRINTALKQYVKAGDVLDAFKAEGKGRQTRINTALKEYVKAGDVA